MHQRGLRKTRRRSRAAELTAFFTRTGLRAFQHKSVQIPLSRFTTVVRSGNKYETNPWREKEKKRERERSSVIEGFFMKSTGSWINKISPDIVAPWLHNRRCIVGRSVGLANARRWVRARPSVRTRSVRARNGDERDRHASEKRDSARTSSRESVPEAFEELQSTITRMKYRGAKMDGCFTM